MSQAAVRAIDAVIFDLDGTLIDSAPGIAAALNVLLADVGLPPVALDLVKLMIGDGAPKLVERGFAAAGRRLTPEKIGIMVARYAAMLEAEPPGPETLYPDVAATLAKLRAAGHRLGVCTNKPAGATEAALTATGIAGLFDAVIGGDTLPQRKPAAEPLLAVLARLDWPPGRAAMVGDSANDIGTARAAGVPAIAVSYGYPRMPVAALGADLVIDRFDQLPAALARLGKA